jgi:pimeloyl-ACP methyl ester carboxylesterase
MVAAQLPQTVRAIVIGDSPLSLRRYQEIINSGRSLFIAWRNLASSRRSSAEFVSALGDIPVSMQKGDTPIRFGDVPGVTTEWLLFLAECLSQVDPDFFTPFLEDFETFSNGYDCEKLLSVISCPILLLQGDSTLGGLMTDEEVNWALAHFSQVTHIRFEGIGHELHLKRAEPVLRAVTNFLESL